MSERPNILIITTDQQRWDALGFLNTPGVRTPHLDALARGGIFFHRAYTPAPVCTPARVSMITGQYSTRHGAWSIGMEPVPALSGPTLGSLFTGAGYATALIGKTHFVARKIEDQHVAGLPLDADPNDYAFWQQFDGPYCGFQYVRHCQNHNADRAPSAHYRRWLNKKGLNLDHLHKRQVDGTLNEIPPGCWEGMRAEWTQNAWIAEETIHFLKAQNENDDPWLVMANFQDPHYPMVCPEPFYSAVDMGGVNLGSNDEEHLDKPPFYREFKNSRRFADGPDREKDYDFATPVTGLPWNMGPPNINPFAQYGEDREPAIRAYLGMVAMVDHYVGAILSHLRETGQWENTLIIFTSDHGEILGRHGVWGKGLHSYDDNQRVPALMHWPVRQTGPIGCSASHFNLVDILPTALDAAGIESPSFVQGVSQLPALAGESVRDWALVDFYATPKCHQQTLIWKEKKIVVYRHANYGELYDLADDPDQLRNLWDSPEWGQLRSEMLLKLAQANMTIAGQLPERISYA